MRRPFFNLRKPRKKPRGKDLSYNYKTGLYCVTEDSVTYSMPFELMIAFRNGGKGSIEDWYNSLDGDTQLRIILEGTKKRNNDAFF